MEFDVVNIVLVIIGIVIGGVVIWVLVSRRGRDDLPRRSLALNEPTGWLIYLLG